MIKENSSKEEMLKNVEHSTECALLALTQLEKNLVNGRFKEGITVYDSMCNTLIGQRIWTCNKNCEQLDNNFKKISVTAKNIIEILLPYIHSLQKLININAQISIVKEGANQVGRPFIDNSLIDENVLSDEEKVLLLIKNSPKNQISYTKLHSLLCWERKRVDKILKILVEMDKSVSIILAGSRRMVKFKT